MMVNVRLTGCSPVRRSRQVTGCRRGRPRRVVRFGASLRAANSRRSRSRSRRSHCSDAAQSREARTDSDQGALSWHGPRVWRPLRRPWFSTRRWGRWAVLRPKFQRRHTTIIGVKLMAPPPPLTAFVVLRRRQVPAPDVPGNGAFRFSLACNHIAEAKLALNTHVCGSQSWASSRVMRECDGPVPTAKTSVRWRRLALRLGSGQVCRPMGCWSRCTGMMQRRSSPVNAGVDLAATKANEGVSLLTCNTR